jgi:spermidine synthase
MLPWQVIEQAAAPDGTILELRVRGKEYLIRADGRDLMSRADEVSSRALAELGCAHIDRGTFARVLVGGLGMGYTLRAALDQLGEHAIVEVAELVPAVARWNQAVLGALADHPLQDPRTKLHLGDVRARIRAARAGYHAILLDVDNGPDALAHSSNDALYGARGISEAWTALRPGGVFAIWSFSDDPNFTRRLERRGFTVRLQRVSASRKGRGRYHFVWLAMKAQHDG